MYFHEEERSPPELAIKLAFQRCLDSKLLIRLVNNLQPCYRAFSVYSKADYVARWPSFVSNKVNIANCLQLHIHTCTRLGQLCSSINSDLHNT